MIKKIVHSLSLILCTAFLLLFIGNTQICLAQDEQVTEFNQPWRDSSRAIIIDTFEGNAINWKKLSEDERVAAIIHRATMGTKRKDRLYTNRRSKAKQRGYKWGSYHLGMPGNPIKQADFYLKTVKPKKDELIALDLEDVDSPKFMSIEDAQLFIKRIKEKTGRYPLVYGNYKTVRKIALSIGKDEYLANTPLWYARFRRDVDDFPNATWDSYTIWQFSCEINCKPDKLGECLYLVPGTEYDMDVNVYNGTVAELRKNWPFGKE